MLLKLMMIYSLYHSKEITQKVYTNIIKSIQIQKMDTIFMNSVKVIILMF